MTAKSNRLRGIRSPIVGGYLLGRLAAGTGDVQQIPIQDVAAQIRNITAGVPVPLTSAHIFVGDSGGFAADVAVSGDATMANTGALTVTKLQGRTVSAAAPSDGNVLTWVAANNDWEPSNAGTGLTHQQVMARVSLRA